MTFEISPVVRRERTSAFTTLLMSKPSVTCFLYTSRDKPRVFSSCTNCSSAKSFCFLSVSICCFTSSSLTRKFKLRARASWSCTSTRLVNVRLNDAFICCVSSKPLYCRDNCSVTGSIASLTSVMVIMSSFTMAAMPSTSCVLCAQVRETPSRPPSTASTPRPTTSQQRHCELRTRSVICLIGLPFPSPYGSQSFTIPMTTIIPGLSRPAVFATVICTGMRCSTLVKLPVGGNNANSEMAAAPIVSTLPSKRRSG